MAEVAISGNRIVEAAGARAGGATVDVVAVMDAARISPFVITMVALCAGV